MEILKMNETHVPGIAEIERLCFSDPWSENSIAGELTSRLSHWLVAVEGEQLLGYIGSQSVLGQSDMMNVAVHPDHRRQGIAEALILALSTDLMALGNNCLTLEVRASLGFLLPILQMFAIIESLPLALLNNLISLTLWVRIVFVGGAIANTTYVISSLYGLYMTTRMVFRWLSLYKEQNAPSATTEEQEILQEQL